MFVHQSLSPKAIEQLSLILDSTLQVTLAPSFPIPEFLKSLLNNMANGRFTRNRVISAS